MLYVFGEAYTEKYTFKKGVEKTTITNTRNGSVSAVDSTVGNIDGYTTIKLADDTAKKAVKWDLKSDYTGWMSGEGDVIDTIDFIKFKTGKSTNTLEIKGLSAGNEIWFDNRTYIVGESGEISFELDMSTSYTLKLEIDEGDASMNYTLAIV